MSCAPLSRRVAILACGLAWAWSASSPARAQDLQPSPWPTLVELSLGMGAYFFKVEQVAFDDYEGERLASSEHAQGAALGFHFGSLLGWRVHPQLRLGVAWELAGTRPAPTEVHSLQRAFFFVVGPALRYAPDERRGFTAQLRLSAGGIFPIGWALGGGLGAGYALPLGKSFAVTFGVDCKVAHAQLEDGSQDGGDYHDSGWMVAPSGLVSFLL